MWFWIWTIFIFFVLVVFNSKKVINFINFMRRIELWHKVIRGPGFFECWRNLTPEKFLPWMKTLCKRYGPIFSVWIGNDLFVFVADRENALSVLTNNQLLMKSCNYNLIVPWLGRGLLTNGGERWHIQRKLLTTAYQSKTINDAIKQSVQKHCDILISKLKSNFVSEEFDVYQDLYLYTLDVIFESATGINIQVQDQVDSKYAKNIQTVKQLIHRRAFSFWRRIDLFYKFTAESKKCSKIIKDLREDMNRIIGMRKKALVADQIQGIEDINQENSGSKRSLGFLDVLLFIQKEGANLSDRHVREEVDSFLFGGFDTTSSALGFTLYLLSQYQDVQQKIYEEIASQKDGSMKYLEAAIKESLRIYPVVPFYSRKLQDDVQLGDKKIPVGTNFSVLAYLVNKDPKHNFDPEKFEPERHLMEEKDELSTFCFSTGPRKCIGQTIAMLLLKSTIINLLKAFKFLKIDCEPIPYVELLMNMKSANGFIIKLEKRSI